MGAERQIIMTAQDNQEFAIRRIADGLYLYDDNMDGTRPEWVQIADNAAWFGTAEEAVAFAELAGFGECGELDHGLEVADRPWVWKEDIEPDEVDLELDREEAEARAAAEQSAATGSASDMRHAEAGATENHAPAAVDPDAIRGEFLEWVLRAPSLRSGKPLSEITARTLVSHLRHMDGVLVKTGSALAGKVEPAAFDYGSYEQFRPVRDAIMDDPEFIKNSRRVNRNYLRTAIQYYLRFLAERDGATLE